MMNETNQDNVGDRVKRFNITLTDDDKQALRDCARESFIYRELPLMGVFATFVAFRHMSGFYLNKTRGQITLRYVGAVVLGDAIGQLSYYGKCKAKFQNLDKSVLKEAFTPNPQQSPLAGVEKERFATIGAPSNVPGSTAPKVRMPTVDDFTPDDARVLRECHNEAFYQRGIPLAIIMLGLSRMVDSKGYLQKYPRPVVGIFYLANCLMGFVFGRISYVNKCKEKFRQLEDSVIKDFLLEKSTPKLNQKDLSRSRDKEPQPVDLTPKESDLPSYDSYAENQSPSTPSSFIFGGDKSVQNPVPYDPDRPFSPYFDSEEPIRDQKD